MLAPPKNFIGAAATDLGIGVQQQLQEQEAERKKKLASMQPQQSLFGAAASNLLGQGGFGG